MMVVDNESAYNAILGMPWIHDMDAVTSFLHQMIKFQKGETIIVKNDQKIAQTYFMEKVKDNR